MADSRQILRARCPQHEQGLMLLWLNPGSLRGSFAEGQEAPDLETKLLDLPVVEEVEVTFAYMHDSIVSRYIRSPMDQAVRPKRRIAGIQIFTRYFWEAVTVAVIRPEIK